MAEARYVGVVTALLLALYGAITGPMGVKLRWAPLVRTAQYVVPKQCVLVTAAALAFGLGIIVWSLGAGLAWARGSGRT
jgi:hypothetical protein